MNLRYLWRSLLSVFVLWFALSPALCYASETATTNSAIDYPIMTLDLDEDSAEDGILQYKAYFWSDTGRTFSISYKHTINSQAFNDSYSLDIPYKNLNCASQQFLWEFNSIDGTRLFKQGDIYNISFTGLGVSMREHGVYAYSTGNGSSYEGDHTYAQYNIPIEECTSICLRFFDSSGGNTNIWFTPDEVLSVYNGSVNLYFEDLEIPFDTYRVSVFLANSSNLINLGSEFGSKYGEQVAKTFTMSFTMNNSSFVFEKADSSTGLLNGIIEWLRSIRDGITGVADSIIQLPSKIWTVMENGLKGLFVPSQEDIQTMYNDWETLLRDRFGAIYQAGDIAHDFAENLQTQSAQIIDTGGVIEMPSVTANLAGTNFTFGGYTVDIIPNGFEFLADALKSITNIICTVIFINMLRNKLEELIR